jgi:flagellar hook assembly protein FlgD
VDYTSLKEQYLQKIVKQMDQLQRLSIENMNGKPIKYIRKDLNPWKRKKYGFITPSFFEKLRNKTLKYVNICNSSDNLVGCEALSSYEWDGYDQLECIRANTGLLSAETISKL